MINKNSVAVIILNWNGYDDTCEAIQSTLMSDYASFDILVVDNGSDNDEAQKLQTKFGPKIKVIKSKENLGYCGGNNLGAKYARKQGYDYFIVLNNDVIVDAKLISNLVFAIEKDKKTAAVNPVVYQYYKKKIIENTGLRFSLWHGVATSINLNQEKIIDMREPDVLSGTCFIFRTSALDSIKYLFDQDYFCYYEDPDLSVRLKKAGYLIAVNYDACIWHKGLASAKKISGFAEYQAIKNRFLMEEKNASLIQKAVFLMVNLFLYFPFRFLKITVFRGEGNLNYFLRGFSSGLKILFGGTNDKYS